MQHRMDFSRTGAAPRSRTRRKTVVIADDGVEVTIVLLDDTVSPTIGALFSHRGRRWEICGSRQGSRVLVAEPADHPRQ